MAQYALLILPSANRVYANASVALTQAELGLFSRSVLDDRLGEVSASTIGGVPYVTFAADLTGRDAAFLANLSCAYALFRVEGDLLRPVVLGSLGRFDDDLLTILKYQGKTNEQFTRLLLNVTLLSSAYARDMLDRKFAVIDPLCGRGTTLNQALMLGFDAAGLDVDRKDFEAYSAFIQTWLKRKRIKHHVDFSGPVRRNRQVVARRLQISLAATKEAQKAGPIQQLDVVNADTTRAGEFFAPESYDLVSRGARLTCWLRPSRCGPGCCAAAARSESPGTPSSRPATRPRRSSPARALTRWTPAPTWRSGTAWTRRSAGTS